MNRLGQVYSQRGSYIRQTFRLIISNPVFRIKGSTGHYRTDIIEV